MYSGIKDKINIWNDCCVARLVIYFLTFKRNKSYKYLLQKMILFTTISLYV